MTTSTRREIIEGFEDILGGKKFPPAIKFEGLNQPQTLIVTGMERIQDRSYNPNGLGDLRTWPDGRPMMIAVMLGTDKDDNQRSLFIKGANLTHAFKDAIREADVAGIAIGDHVTVAWIDEEPVTNNKGVPIVDAKGEPMLAKVFSVTLAI